MSNGKRPNLVYIFTDQQRADTMAAYGNDWIETPNLNRLADECLVFENAYVSSPICTPSRSTQMTGLWPHTNGCVKNNIPLPQDVQTFAEFFPGDYHTAYYGKWHLGDEGFFPEDQGFDEAFWHGGGGVGQLPDYYGNTLFDTTFIENDQAVKTKGFTGSTCKDASRFIEQALGQAEREKLLPEYFQQVGMSNQIQQGN